MRNITVIRGGAIGDFVLTLPAIETLRQTYPDASLRLIGHPPTLRLAHPDEVLDHDSPLLAPLHLREASPPPDTAALFADVDFLLAYAVDPHGILGDHLRALTNGPTLVHDPRPLPGSTIHLTDHLLQPLRRHGIPAPASVPRIHLRNGDHAYAIDCWERYQLRYPVIIIHPGSGGRHKCWPLDRFLELAERLRQRRFCVVILQGPVETERKNRLPADLLSLSPPALLDLAALLARADLFIGNDSGPGHVAAAVGTPTLTLFGPTDPRLWRPHSPRTRTLQAAAGQWPALTVDSVLEAALKSLEEFSGTAIAGDHG